MSANGNGKGRRWFAALYDHITHPNERAFRKIRPRIMGDVQGCVLEVGVGTGASFAYFPAQTRVMGTEPDPYMLERARRRLGEMGANHIELHQAVAEELPFEDDSFDHVVCSLVLCTVRDQPRALVEARRVLKPEGTLRFLEHVRNDDSRFWGVTQDVVAPVWSWLNGGCHSNRRTQQAIEDAGFRIDWLERIHVGPGTWAIYGMARQG
jgi:ubiquinone/menaquinone biosynthesis C-methylase UbiE